MSNSPAQSSAVTSQRLPGVSARAVAASLVRYLTLCVQPELVPLVIEEMQRWRAPAPAEEPA